MEFRVEVGVEKVGRLRNCAALVLVKLPMPKTQLTNSIQNDDKGREVLGAHRPHG